MNKRKKITVAGLEPVWLTVAEAQARYNLGRCTVIKLAEETGAVRRIGRTLRLDVRQLDAAFTK